MRRPNSDDLLQQEGEFSTNPDTPSPYQDTSSSAYDISSSPSNDSASTSCTSLQAFERLETVRKERTPTQTD